MDYDGWPHNNPKLNLIRDTDNPALPDVSPAKYQFMNEFYGKDDHIAYFKGMPINGSDAKTFVLSGDYAKDDQQGRPINYRAKLVAGADPKTFTMIKGEKIDYAKDKTRYFWGGSAE